MSEVAILALSYGVNFKVIWELHLVFIIPIVVKNGLMVRISGGSSILYGYSIDVVTLCIMVVLIFCILANIDMVFYD